MKSGTPIKTFIPARVLRAVAVIAVLVSGTMVQAKPPMKPSGHHGSKPIGVPTEKDFPAYLFVFHQDADHSLHMALSSDGYFFTDVNGGQAVMSGRDLAEQKGIRDPYIARGPDGAFYLGMTDLHIFAQREGLRDTYVLMYDVFGVRPHNFGFSETTDFKTIGHFNEGVMKTTNFSSPKHGAIIPLAKKKANRLAKHWEFKDY